MSPESKHEKIDRLLLAFEAMIDARINMVHEKRYANYRFVEEIRDTIYEPEKEKARKLLLDFLFREE